MTFEELFTTSFFDMTVELSVSDMALAMALAFIVGAFIFVIYRHTYSGVMYSESFGVSLVAMTMITTLVILVVAQNIILSLGMVGALSIVRFRAAIKDPIDIVFLFWSIAVGIVLAAGPIGLAILGSVLIGVVLFVFIKRKSLSDPYILMVVCDDQAAEERVRKMLAGNVRKQVVKSKSVSRGGIELNFEIRLKEEDTAFVNRLSETEGVSNAMLVSYNGDYMG